MSWKSFIKSHLDSLQSQLFTTLPAIVTDVSNLELEQTISVRPTIDILHSDGQINECPEIYNVPVIFPSAGGGILSFPIKVGDNVLVQFSMRNLENWLEGDGNSVVENTMRSHDMSDAIAIVGLTTKANTLNPSPKDVVLKFKGSSITIKDNSDIEIIQGESASSVSLFNSGDIEMFANGNMNISATGIITIAGSQLVLQQ